MEMLTAFAPMLMLIVHIARPSRAAQLGRRNQHHYHTHQYAAPRHPPNWPPPTELSHLARS
eukprot:2514441-Pleurochrysis_carterae.AAC.2